MFDVFVTHPWMSACAVTGVLLLVFLAVERKRNVDRMRQALQRQQRRAKAWCQDADTQIADWRVFERTILPLFNGATGDTLELVEETKRLFTDLLEKTDACKERLVEVQTALQRASFFKLVPGVAFVLPKDYAFISLCAKMAQLRTLADFQAVPAYERMNIGRFYDLCLSASARGVPLNLLGGKHLLHAPVDLLYGGPPQRGTSTATAFALDALDALRVEDPEAFREHFRSGIGWWWACSVVTGTEPIARALTVLEQKRLGALDAFARIEGVPLPQDGEHPKVMLLRVQDLEVTLRMQLAARPLDENVIQEIRRVSERYVELCRFCEDVHTSLQGLDTLLHVCANAAVAVRRLEEEVGSRVAEALTVHSCELLEVLPSAIQHHASEGRDLLSQARGCYQVDRYKTYRLLEQTQTAFAQARRIGEEVEVLCQRLDDAYTTWRTRMEGCQTRYQEARAAVHRLNGDPSKLSRVEMDFRDGPADYRQRHIALDMIECQWTEVILRARKAFEAAHAAELRAHEERRRAALPAPTVSPANVPTGDAGQLSEAPTGDFDTTQSSGA